MGQLSKLDVVYDTASDWLVVESADCESCEGNRYDIGPSLEAGTAVQISEESYERVDGQIELTGKDYTDTVCITLSACLEFF